MRFPLTSTRSWQRLGIVMLLGTLVFVLSGDVPAKPGTEQTPSEVLRKVLEKPGMETAVSLSSEILRKGLQLLTPKLVDINIQSVSITLGMAPRTEETEKLDQRLKEITERLNGEPNEDLRQRLAIMRQQLEADRQRNQLLVQQNQSMRDILDHHVRAFNYQKSKDEAVLRKMNYTFPADKLVVVVADFSSGDADTGREIADEITHQLNELQKKYGIDVYVLSGEIRPGVIIRSEEMAQDIGRHFPPTTNYVVIWGTMSPRTVGRYRPHLTCIQKISQDQGVSVTFNIELGSEKLPLPTAPVEYEREAYLRFIGTTCAAIPGCYAAHEISRERTPQLDKYYEFLGKDSAEAVQFQKDLEPLTRWTKVRKAMPGSNLRRLSAIAANSPYPRYIVNEKDDSILVLITEATDPSSDQPRPKRFLNENTKKDYLVYMDVTETSNDQYVKFLNASGGNREEGGNQWIKLDPEYRDIYAVSPEQFALTQERLGKYAVIDVNWFGAKAYCRWAGKELPRQDEWRIAASPAGDGLYPWGKEFNGKFCRSGLSDEKLHNGRGRDSPPASNPPLMDKGLRQL